MQRLIQKLTATVMIAVIFIIFASPRPTYATTYATFNSGDCNGSLLLTNGNLTVTHNNTNAWQSCRSNTGKSSGKWYVEITEDIYVTNNQYVCVSTSVPSLSNYLSADAQGWCYASDGSKQNNNVGAAYGTAWNSGGTVLGIYYDAGAGTLGFTRNGVDQGQAYSGLSGTLYVGISIFDITGKQTANYGATALTYTPPTGYCAGLVDSCGGGSPSFNFMYFFGW